MTLIVFLLLVIGTYVSAYVIYDCILLFANVIIRDKDIAFPTPKIRFGIIIPAHNEELFLERLVRSIKNQNYPFELLKIIVVADNCTDKTAEIALNNGALVLERSDLRYAGKGYAVKFVLEKIDLDELDAIFIIDADSIIDNDLLAQLDKALRSGKKIIQCYNGVANPNQSWFTRLLDVSRTIGNEIYHPAKQKLGLSSYLMGNGMCFTTKILQKYGWDAFTIGEDWEYYARLIQEGEIVSFANKARVYHQESSSLKQATSQRMRWSSGRFAIAFKYGFSLFYHGVREMNIVKVDGSLPLLFPNPSLGMNMTILGFMLSVLTSIVTGSNIFLLWFSGILAFQFLIFVIGIMYTRNKVNNFLSIFVAPIFLIWKMGIDTFSALGIGRKRWIRTERRL